MTMTSRFDGFAMAMRRDRRGTAAIEFGITIPFLLTLVVGLSEIGMASYESMQVNDAAEAGVLYASQHPADIAGIQAAVASATGTAGITASPAPTSFCGCPSTDGITVGNCVSLCASGNAQGQYVQVNASYTHSPIMTLPSFPNPLVITSSATLRTQ